MLKEGCVEFGIKYLENTGPEGNIVHNCVDQSVVNYALKLYRNPPKSMTLLVRIECRVRSKLFGVGVAR